MNNRISNSIWGIWFISFLICGLCMVLVPDVLFAQRTATLTGHVRDADRDDFLPGANVYLDGTSFGSATDREGEYTIYKVPPGTYTLKVSYVGYADYTSEVIVPEEGGIIGFDVALNVAYLETSEIVVMGLREGQAKALNQQKTATNLMNVVDKEQMQRFPDLNTAEVLQRIPAISITRDQGEGRYVLIRGTQPRLNAVSINGERVASPEDEERFIGMDVISTNQVASIEVTKALTPDMDADAIGGSINLVMKSAFDFNRRTLNVSAGAGYGDLREKMLTQGDLSYSDFFGPRNEFGITVNGNFYDSNRGSDNNEMEWGNVDDINGVELPWALQDLQLRYYNVDRFRYGFSTILDYRPNDNHRYFLNGMYNRRDDDEQRQRLRIRPDAGEYVSRTEITDGEFERELKDRLETQVLYSIAAGGKNDFQGWALDYTVGYSFAKEDKPNEIDPTFVMNTAADFNLNLQDPDIPQYNITSLQPGYEMNASNYILDEIAFEHNLNKNEDYLASVNLKFPYNFAGYPAELKMGGKYHSKQKNRNNEIWTYGWEGDNDILMSQLTSGKMAGEIFNGDYKEVGPLVDPKKSRNFFWHNKDKEGFLEGELEYVDTYGEKYNVDESVTGVYAMSTNNFGDWLILAGLRFEMAQYDFDAYNLEFDADGEYVSHSPISDSGDESHILPNLQARFRLTPQSNLRFAFTSALARPNYYDHVPYFIVNREDEEIFKGNSSLKSTTSYNFDVFGEHYFSGLGILSGGFFYKSLDKIIYKELIELSGGELDGFEQTQPVNGKKGWLYGFEINWSQQFTFLPGLWNGFGVYANYTWIDSEAELRTDRKSKLPGQASNVANLALVYEKYGFLGRVSMNYHGNFIEEVGEDSENDLIYDDHVQWDISASQQVIPGLRLYLEVVNLNDAMLRYYWGKSNRPVQRESYSWWAHFGVKYEL